MAAIVLVYRYGETLAYAVGGVIALGGVAGLIVLICYMRSSNKGWNAFGQVVEGGNKFLKDNTDPNAAKLFKDAQKGAQDTRTRELIKKVN